MGDNRQDVTQVWGGGGVNRGFDLPREAMFKSLSIYEGSRVFSVAAKEVETHQEE